VVQEELAFGTWPASIGYFSFTRKASTEARGRATQKFPHLNPNTDFPWFRTLHSLAYRCLGVTGADMMTPEHFQEFAKLAGLDVMIGTENDEEFVVRADNPILNEINIARVRGEDLREHYNRSSLKIEWHYFEYIERAYRHYKDAHNLLDFTDLLERVADEPHRLPALEVVIVDEAQDLSRLQWRVVRELADRAQRVFIGGDDDQAIFNFAGADVESFLGFPGNIKILDQSYRVPAKIHEMADRVVHRIRHRQPKVWRAREEEGEIHVHSSFRQVDVTSGDWLILAAANFMLTETYEWLKSLGLLFERHGQRSIPESVLSAVLGWERLRKGGEVTFPVLKSIYAHLDPAFVARGHKTLKTAAPDDLYSMDRLKDKHGLKTDIIWHEALTKISEDRRRYIMALLRRGTRLMGHVPIKVSTIHGAKGGEADNVLLLTDLTTKFTRETSADDLNRLFYVGLTRAKKHLHLVLPKDIQRGFRL